MSARCHRAQLLAVAVGVFVTTSVADAQSRAAEAGARRSVSVVLHELGPLVEGGSSWAHSINNRGAVVGEATTETGRFIPFLWTPQHGFERILGDVRGVATDINDAGDVIGMYFSSDDDMAPGMGFLWSRTHGFVDLGDFQPEAINNRGQIAGRCNRPELRACLWEDGVVTQLGVLPGHQFSMALGISNRGHVVGQSFATGERGRAFVWKPRTGMVALESPAGSVAFGINNRGQIAGTLSDDAGIRAVVWSREGRIVRLGPADEFTGSNAINARGWALGIKSVNTFVWLPSGEMHLLGEPGEISVGRAINNRGQVAGWVDGGDRLVPTAVVWTVRVSNSRTAP